MLGDLECPHFASRWTNRKAVVSQMQSLQRGPTTSFRLLQYYVANPHPIIRIRIRIKLIRVKGRLSEPNGWTS